MSNEPDDTDRPALIGPRTYRSWSRATRALVLPIVLIVLVVTRLAHHDGIWASIFPPIGISLTVGMWMLVIVTALFAAIDRGR